MRSPVAIAKKFASIDAHDDTIEAIEVIPAAVRSPCRVKIVLNRHWKQQRRSLELIGCVNIAFAVDATMLFDNRPSNTCVLEASAAVGDIAKLMRSQRRAWNLTYEGGMNPLQPKIDAASKYVLFRIRLFGGNLEVVAKSFKFSRLTLRPNATP